MYILQIHRAKIFAVLYLIRNCSSFPANLNKNSRGVYKTGLQALKIEHVFHNEVTINQPLGLQPI